MRKIPRPEWLVALAWGLAGVLAFTATRTRFVFLWDSAEFALAIRDFDVSLSQPHPPGYFLYVMLGRMVNWFVGNPHASLVWLSVVAGGVLVAMMFRLGTEMFGRKTGMAAALVTLTSPMVWFYSSVALTYVVDAALVTTLVWVCWRARGTVSWRAVVVMAGLLGVIGGVRQQSVPGMLPLVVVTLAGAGEQRAGKWLVALGVFLVVSVGWVTWMICETGGWAAYWEPAQRITRFHLHKTFWGGGWPALGWNVFFSVAYCFAGLLLGGMLLVVDGRKLVRLPAGRWLGGWVVPVLGLATLVGYSEAPGHVFTYLPALLLAVAVMNRGAIRLGLVCAVNVGVFLFWPVASPILRTVVELRSHDRRMADCVAAIRERFQPEETVICFRGGDLFYGLRLFQWELPEYFLVRLDEDRAMVTRVGRPLMAAVGGRTEFVGEVGLAGKRNVLLVLPPGEVVAGFAPWVDAGSVELVPGSGGMAYRVSVQGLNTIRPVVQKGMQD